LSLSILLLSTLSRFEGFDFIMWFPISFIIIHGVNILSEKNSKLFSYFSILFIVFAIPEIVRIFYTQ
jgi:hypothetical protein